MILNSRYIRYLFDLAEKNRNSEILDDKGKWAVSEPAMLSYLYRWLYVINNPFREFLRDVVSQYKKHRKGAVGDPLECDIELILLAWLINTLVSLVEGSLRSQLELTEVMDPLEVHES